KRGKKILRRHVGKVSVGGNRVAGEEGGDTARIKARPAGERESEQFARGVAEKGEILCEMAAFGDALEDTLALGPGVVTGFDLDIVGVEGEEQQADQSDVVEAVFAKGFGERIGAEIADDRHALLGNAGPGFCRDGGSVIVRLSGSLFSFLRSRCRKAEDDLLDRAAPWINAAADRVAFLFLAPDAFRFRRKFRIAIIVGWKDDTVLRQIGLEPCGLGGEEAFDIGGISCVFVGGNKKVFFPNDTESLLLVRSEFCLRNVEEAFFEGGGN